MMEAEMLMSMSCVNGAVEGLDVDRDEISAETGNDYVMDCRRRRSPDDRQTTESRQTASLMPWRDVIKDGGDDKMADTTIRRRCDSCKSDVSLTSLPESPTSSYSSDDVMGSPACTPEVAVSSWTPTTGNSSAAAARQPKGEMESPVNAKPTSASGHGTWSRDVVRQAAPAAGGFSIADILRPDFGRTWSRASEPAVSVERRERLTADGRTAAAGGDDTSSYPASLLSSTLRRSLVYPYTAAAAFCAAVAAAGVQRGHQTQRHQELIIQQHPGLNHSASAGGARRLPRDVTYNNNNNNNTKIRSRYSAYDEKGINSGVHYDSVRLHKSAVGRRPPVEHASPAPSSLRAVSTTPAVSRPDQSSVQALSPAASQTSSACTPTINGPAAAAGGEVDAKRDDASLVQLPWPAWVYCTRYSDRPSSGRQSKSCTRHCSTCTTHFTQSPAAAGERYLRQSSGI